MVPTIVVIGGFAILRTAGLLGVAALDGWHPALRAALALMFLLTASAHFLGERRAELVAMVPPRLPAPALLVTVTGLLELAGAVGLLVPGSLSRIAAAALAALMLAMFPANVHAARAGRTLAGRAVTPLPLRTAMQVLFVGAALAVALL